jgi:hypothetical protein
MDAFRFMREAANEVGMVSWLPIPRASAHLPQWRVQKVPGFAQAPEYKALGSADLQLPGVVCGACAQFLRRLQHDALMGSRREVETASVSAAYDVLEWLATSHTPDVLNAVVGEIFEHLDDAPQVLEALKTHHGQASGHLYDTWLG